MQWWIAASHRADANTNAGTFAQPVADAERLANAIPDTNTIAKSHAVAYTEAFTDADAQADSDSDTDANANPDANSDSDTNADTNAHTFGAHGLGFVDG